MAQTSLHEELIETASTLAIDGSTQADYRRSISTSYYALFHWLATSCSDMLAGSDPQTRSRGAWRQIYRRLDHNSASKRCQRLLNPQFRRQNPDVRFPDAIVGFAEEFVRLRQERNFVDYEPGFSDRDPDDVRKALALGSLVSVIRAELAIMHATQTSEKDRRAFAIWILFQKPRN